MVVAGVPGTLSPPPRARLDAAEEDKLECRLLPAARGECVKAECEAEVGLIGDGCLRARDGVVPAELELVEDGRGDCLPGPTELLPDTRLEDETCA